MTLQRSEPANPEIPLDSSPEGRRNVAEVTWSLVAGGAEMFAFTVASHLNRRKYKTFFCALDQGGALEPEIDRAGIPCAVMHRRAGIDFGLMWRLYRFYRSNRIDVIHSHHFNQLFYSVLGAKLVGARIIHTEHSIEFYRHRRMCIALRFLSLFCHKVVAIGSDSARILSQNVGIPQRKLEVIRAGVETADFTMPKSQARRELGIAEADRVATIVARLSPEKNHRLLLAAFAQVLQSETAARLLIVGDGAEQEGIRQEIERLGLQDSIQMLGVRRDVARILAASDLFVLSSDREGLPIAVLEAMAAGKPVVATAVGDLPTVVKEGETGCLVPPKDLTALAQAIASLLSDAPRAVAWGENGRRLVSESYSTQTMIRKFEALFCSE